MGVYVSKPKVMIIEDDAITALELQNKLESWGYEVPAIASYGKDAIETVKKINVDLILADIVIKGDLDGVDTVKKISESLETPVLYITAHADDETFNRAKLTKPYGYVFKPYNDQELKFNIEIALYKSNLENNKQIIDQKERLKVINEFILSSTPALVTNVHIEDTATILNSFAKIFTENMKNHMEKELGINTLDKNPEKNLDPDKLFDDYLQWISKFFTNLGYSVETGKVEFKISECIWGSRTMDNKIICLMCRAMADLTFKWTNLDGKLQHEYKMGVDPPICHFKYKFN